MKRDNGYSSVTDFVVSGVAVRIRNGRMLSVELTNGCDGSQITLSPSAGGVISFSGINTQFSLRNGSVRLGPSGLLILWESSKVKAKSQTK